LTFDRRYLDPALAQAHTVDETRTTDEEKKRISELREAHVNAPRALCELAYAKKIELEGRFLTFDFRQALHSDSGPIIAGLIPVDAFKGDATGWPVRLNGPGLLPERNLQSVARALLDGWDTAPDRIELPLPVGEHPSISASCNLIEFALKVTRDPGKVPVNDPTQWTVVRTLVRPTRLEWTGPQLEPAVGTDRSFRQFLNALHKGRAVIQPDQETRDRSGKLLGLLSDGGAESAGAWIVPEGLKRLDGRSIMASITPLSFVPVKPNPQLGPQTFELAKRYLKGLQLVLSLTPGAWTPKGGDDQEVVAAWTEFLTRLESQGPAILKMAERIRDLLRPVHLAAGGPDDQELDDEVRRAIKDLTNPDTDPAKEIQEKARSLLLKDLSLFGEAKALLYTRLSDGDSRSKITPAFHAWETLRWSAGDRPQDRRQRSPQDRPPYQDQRRLSYRDGLIALAGQYGYGFLEVLPDAGYGNDFTLKDAKALSFESLIEPFERGSKQNHRKRDPSIPLNGNGVRLPNKSLWPNKNSYIPLSENAKRLVFLPSRQPIREPALASAEIFDEIQNDQDWSKEIKDNSFDLQELLGGRLEPPAKGPWVSVRAATTSRADQSSAFDDFLVTGIFQVWSDEEDGFSEDTFDLWIEDADESESQETASRIPAVRLSEAFLEQLFKLSDSPRIQGIQGIQDLDRLLDHVDEAGSLLEPVSDPGEEMWDTKPSLRLEVAEENNREVLRRIDVTNPASYLEAFLLRVQPVEPNAPPRPRAYYLFVAAERPIWRRTAIRLGQSRNRKDIEGPDFAPIFGFTSRSRTSAVPQQYTLIRDLDCELKLPARVVTWAQLETALVAQKFLLSSSLRQQHLVVVSVFHEQQNPVRIGYFDPDRKEPEPHETPKFLSRFAVEVVNINPGEADSKQIWFPEPFERFLLDLQWFSSRNRELLRLNRIRVAFPPST